MVWRNRSGRHCLRARAHAHTHKHKAKYAHLNVTTCSSQMDTNGCGVCLLRCKCKISQLSSCQHPALARAWSPILAFVVSRWPISSIDQLSSLTGYGIYGWTGRRIIEPRFVELTVTSGRNSMDGHCEFLTDGFIPLNLCPNSCHVTMSNKSTIASRKIPTRGTVTSKSKC